MAIVMLSYIVTKDFLFPELVQVEAEGSRAKVNGEKGKLSCRGRRER